MEDVDDCVVFFFKQTKKKKRSFSFFVSPSAPFSVLSRDFLSIETINGVNESIKAVC